MKHNLRGMTLIELLVVITIIGVISTVVITGVRNARIAAADAVVKQTLSGVRTVVELDSSRFDSTYSNPCAVGSSTNASLLAALRAINPDATPDDIGDIPLQPGEQPKPRGYCNATNRGWVVGAPLKSLSKPAAQYLCIDSAGNQRIVASLPAGSVSCPD